MGEYPEVKPKLDEDGEPINDIERVLIVLMQIRDALLGTADEKAH